MGKESDILSGKDYRTGYIPSSYFNNMWVAISLCKECGHVHGIIDSASFESDNRNFKFKTKTEPICVYCGSVLLYNTEKDGKKLRVWNVDICTGKYIVPEFDLFDFTSWSTSSRQNKGKWLVKLNKVF